MQEVVDVSTLKRDDTIFVPPMDPVLSRFAAAVFRGLGCRAEVLQETLGVGPGAEQEVRPLADDGKRNDRDEQVNVQEDAALFEELAPVPVKILEKGK